MVMQKDPPVHDRSINNNFQNHKFHKFLYMPDIPAAASINEAVELAKRFGRDQSPSFINGILGKLAREEDEK